MPACAARVRQSTMAPGAARAWSSGRGRSGLAGSWRGIPSWKGGHSGDPGIYRRGPGGRSGRRGCRLVCWQGPASPGDDLRYAPRVSFTGDDAIKESCRADGCRSSLLQLRGDAGEAASGRDSACLERHVFLPAPVAGYQAQGRLQQPYS